MVQMFQKFKDIEMNINELRNIADIKLANDLTIKVPGTKSDISSNDNLMVGVPDTTRMPPDLINVYATPALDSMNMYDEYVLTMFPEMTNLPYYEAGEDGSRSKLMNVLPPYDTQQLAEIICQMIEHPEERVQMGENGRLEAKKYLPEQIMPLWRDFYGSLGTTRPIAS